MNRSLLPLVLSLVGVSVAAATCFVMLAPYQLYRFCRGGLSRVRLPRPRQQQPLHPVAVRRYS